MNEDDGRRRVPPALGQAQPVDPGAELRTAVEPHLVMAGAGLTQVLLAHDPARTVDGVFALVAALAALTAEATDAAETPPTCETLGFG